MREERLLLQEKVRTWHVRRKRRWPTDVTFGMRNCDEEDRRAEESERRREKESERPREEESERRREEESERQAERILKFEEVEDKSRKTRHGPVGCESLRPIVWKALSQQISLLKTSWLPTRKPQIPHL
jgi:hypothetical protein